MCYEISGNSFAKFQPRQTILRSLNGENVRIDCAQHKFNELPVVISVHVEFMAIYFNCVWFEEK